jgi:phospholipase/carboxylesterase
MPSLLRRRTRILGLTAILLLPPAVGADPIVQSEVTIAGRRALLVGPEGSSRDAAMPLVVVLHWSGSSPEEIARLADWPALPVRFLFPQGGYPRPTGWSWFPQGYAEMTPEMARAETFRAVDELAAFLDAARRELPTAGAPIVAGVSYGGDLAFLLAVHRPRSVSSAFPVAARFLPEWLPERRTFADRGPWIVALHGEANATVPIAPTRDAVAELRALGYDAELRAYPGVGHDFAAAMRADLGRALAGRIVGDAAPGSRDGAALTPAGSCPAASRSPPRGRPAG